MPGWLQFDIPWMEIWESVLDFWLWLPRRLYELFMIGMGETIALIPVPSWMATPPNISLGVEGISWAFWLFNVSDGIGIVLAAYMIRFAIRRIPVIG